MLRSLVAQAVGQGASEVRFYSAGFTIFLSGIHEGNKFDSPFLECEPLHHTELARRLAEAKVRVIVGLLNREWKQVGGQGWAANPEGKA